MSIDRIEITYTPHHKTLTEAGNSHFHRVVDALAEFVDNSIQASDNEKQRHVHVSFFLNNLDGFLTISDNGVGMTSDTIKQFATYALDRETRSMQSTGRAGIGRFGVGAKQAGFYLGNRIRVITKCKDNEKVMEFYRAAFLNGIVWNVLNLAIAVWLLRRGAGRVVVAS